jgi:molybdenum cofactor synthesis domain-containing protein
MTTPPRTAAALVIGNEILSGKVADANVAYLARELRDLGVSLERVVVVPDDVETIATDLRALSAAYDVVFTSGGVGPTHDDVTIEAVAKAFGRRVVRAPEFEALIRELYGSRLTEAHLKMADVPEGAELVSNEQVRWPTVLVQNVYIFPGIPEIFRAKFPVLRERFRQTPWHLRMVFTVLDEGVLKVPLDEIVARFPTVQLGSYPRLSDPEYHVKITLEAKDRAAVDAATEALVAALPPEGIVRVE